MSWSYHIIDIKNDNTDILSSDYSLRTVERCYEKTESGLYKFADQTDLFYDDDNKALYYGVGDNEFKQINHLPVFGGISFSTTMNEITLFKQFLDNNAVNVASDKDGYTRYLVLSKAGM